VTVSAHLALRRLAHLQATEPLVVVVARAVVGAVRAAIRTVSLVPKLSPGALP
jgi:hypothetical protein